MKMKILLSYSKLHFDPQKSKRYHQHWGSSASILARNLYRILSSIGEVVYIDSSEYQSLKEKKFDLFVGIINNFNKIFKSCQIKKSVLFAVNMHPRERNKILLKYLLKERLNPQALAGWDLVNSIKIEKGIKQTDYILCLGNTLTYNSYIKQGVPLSKIKILNYGVGKAVDQKQKINYKRKKKSFIYVSSEIGLRKGFDILFSLFTDSRIIDKDFHLDIVGLPTNNYYKKKLNKLQEILKNKLTYHGWVNSHSPSYQEIIQNNDFVILPSLEEGQAGSVLDALRYGLIPVISRNCGIDFSPLGFLTTKINSWENQEIIKELISLQPERMEDLKKKTLEYYREFHENFEINLKESIKNCLEGELYPKTSVILPIFNKEKTIMPLIRLLDKACIRYRNVEMHIIFDGCTDNTEKIVRNFYQNIKIYKTTFEKTPNIFEIKTNNIGLKKAKGKYCVIVQDDNYIFDKNIFFEIVSFLEKDEKAAVLGGLAGVNYFPRGTKKLKGKGQTMIKENEVYHRQDERTDSSLKNKIFEVDACMRGPLVIRKSFLEKHGYLDEVYAPLHQDDMDLCFRARHFGYKVYCILTDVVNISLTVANYGEDKAEYWRRVYKRNTDIFYSRWKPSIEKDYLWLFRNKVFDSKLNLSARRINRFRYKKGNPLSVVIKDFFSYIFPKLKTSLIRGNR